MTEATDVHEELVQALQFLIPKTTYQDLRRLNTLAWAITGLCLKQTVRLSAWAEVIQSRAILAASRVRRFSRWLHQRLQENSEKPFQKNCQLFLQNSYQAGIHSPIRILLLRGFRQSTRWEYCRMLTMTF